MNSLKGEIVKRALRLGLIWRPGLLSELIREDPGLREELDGLEKEFKEAWERGDKEECVEILERWEKALLGALRRRKKGTVWPPGEK
ncbi:MAG: hypothetical protein DRQ06_00110 [Candidatus Hydrothermota bacterium]|uniref:Uncharacterized protein n=1 Tax=candidate division WOR-3 bacterium TaxID=2052148 RepID=A0A7C1BF85_UNCW3|nr:MAG: hypothetical protein DRQ06_00110 [Candidatus Hydrothermae bacterium]HDM89608.1 hypothetical protein [candidate division WOR-3 bacterium]